MKFSPNYFYDNVYPTAGIVMRAENWFVKFLKGGTFVKWLWIKT